MGLDISFIRTQPCEVFSDNITHNLGAMAAEAGIYKHLWRPEEIGLVYARELIEPLTVALMRMREDPDRFTVHDAPNGWGVYVHFVDFVSSVLSAAHQYPDATIEVSR